jgi:hypothetical protein
MCNVWLLESWNDFIAYIPVYLKLHERAYFESSTLEWLHMQPSHAATVGDSSGNPLSEYLHALSSHSSEHLWCPKNLIPSNWILILRRASNHWGAEFVPEWGVQFNDRFFATDCWAVGVLWAGVWPWWRNPLLGHNLGLFLCIVSNNLINISE